jgi:hypothetical protein
MNSIRALMVKSEDTLSEFERKVRESQDEAIQARKDLEERVGGTSFGTFNMNINRELPPEEKIIQARNEMESMKYESISLVHGIRGLTQALLYLTENKASELSPWQYFELFTYAKESYPQTIFGQEDIHDGTFLWYRRISSVVEDYNIPLSKEVKGIIEKGLAGEEISEYQHRYMHYEGLDEKEALKHAQEDVENKKEAPDFDLDILN